MLSRKNLPAPGSTPSQRAANSRRKCPLEEQHVPARNRLTTRSPGRRLRSASRSSVVAKSCQSDAPHGSRQCGGSYRQFIRAGRDRLRRPPRSRLLARPGCALQRAGPHLGERQSFRRSPAPLAPAPRQRSTCDYLPVNHRGGLMPSAEVRDRKNLPAPGPLRCRARYVTGSSPGRSVFECWIRAALIKFVKRQADVWRRAVVTDQSW